MPRNRLAKERQREWLARHPGATRKEAREHTQVSVKPRCSQAKKVLHASRGGLVDALVAQLDLGLPADSVTRVVLAEMLDLLDDVAQRPDPLPDDIWDALRRRIAALNGDSFPPAPTRVRHAVVFIERLVSDFADRQLVGIATDLRVTRQDVDFAAVLRWIGGREQRRVEAGDHLDADDQLIAFSDSAECEGERAAEVAAREQFRQRVVGHLQDSGGTAWEDEDRQVLRAAVTLRMATIGDAYLLATEPPAPLELEWRSGPDGAFRADYVVPGAPQPLSAVVRPAIRRDNDPGFSVEFYRPARKRATIGYTCYVGVIDRAHGDPDRYGPDDVEFDRFDIFGPSNLFGGKLVAARMIQSIAANPGIARSEQQYRLLIPRRASQKPDSATRVIDLVDVFEVVADETDDVDEPHWMAWPHVEGSRREVLRSVTALVLDRCAAPWPKPGHPANQVGLASPTFRRFLVAQGVEISELALTYLSGTEKAGTGALSLRVRHGAGLAAVEGRHGLRAVVSALVTRYPAVEESILELGDRESFLEELADPEALGELLARSE